MLRRSLRSALRAAAALSLCAAVHAGDAPAQGIASVLVLGDSLSAGYGLAPEQGWVALAARHEALGDARWINASVNGETTAGALERLPELLARHRPDAIVIELGGNDGLRGYPIAQMQDNLARIVRTAQAAGAKALLMRMRIPPNYGVRYTRRFESAYRKAAESTGAALAPFLLDGVATDPGLMQGDGVHPTAQAQPKMLGNALGALRALLDSARPR